MGFFNGRVPRIYDSADDLQETTVDEMTQSMKPAKKEGEKREWIRVPVSIDFLFAKAADERGGKYDYKKSKTFDISGGGISMATENEFAINDKLKIILELKGGKKLSLDGRVARIADHHTLKSNQRLIGVEFFNISAQDTEYLVRWLFTNLQDLLSKNE